MSAPAETFPQGLELQVAEICARGLPNPGPDALLAALAAAFPQLALRHAMTRGGWHRLGGVVDGDYRRVAEHLGSWAEAACGDGLEALLDRCAEIRGFVTRLEGRTHYFTAATGDAPGAFLQIEVEQLQEVIERPLWDPDWLPDDLEEFIDPLDYPRLEPEPVGLPRLVFRRLVPVAQYLASEDAGAGLARFLADWGRSSAGDGCFSEHWCLAFRESRDRGGRLHLGARPVALGGADAPRIAADSPVRGAALANLIHGFDRRRGYPFAWFFHMLADRGVPHQLAQWVHADQMGAFDYLPARDLAVLRDWHDHPYHL